MHIKCQERSTTYVCRDFNRISGQCLTCALNDVSSSRGGNVVSFLGGKKLDMSATSEISQKQKVKWCFKRNELLMEHSNGEVCLRGIVQPL